MTRTGYDLKPKVDPLEYEFPVPPSDLAGILLGPRAAEVLGVAPVFLRRSLSALGLNDDWRAPRLGSLQRVAALVHPAPSLLVPWHFTGEGVKALEALCASPAPPARDVIEDGIHLLDVHTLLTRLRHESVQSVVTSPPYWGQRIYKDTVPSDWSDGTRCHYGAEATPEDYVRHTLEIFHLMKPVLREGATIWWNVGDTYSTRTQIRTNGVERLQAMREGDSKGWTEQAARRHSAGHEYLKDKDLCLIPQQVAIGAQRLGYWARSWITWEKENTLPETVKDRPTVSHEQIILFSKSKIYDFYLDAWKSTPSVRKLTGAGEGPANLRSVWRFRTTSGRDGHGAQFPIELPARTILLSSMENELVMDPFLGAGTSAIAAKKLGRRFVGCDVVDEYLEVARGRLKSDAKKGRSLEEFS